MLFRDGLAVRRRCIPPLAIAAGHRADSPPRRPRPNGVRPHRGHNPRYLVTFVQVSAMPLLLEISGNCLVFRYPPPLCGVEGLTRVSAGQTPYWRPRWQVKDSNLRSSRDGFTARRPQASDLRLHLDSGNLVTNRPRTLDASWSPPDTSGQRNYLANRPPRPTDTLWSATRSVTRAVSSRRMSSWRQRSSHEHPFTLPLSRSRTRCCTPPQWTCPLPPRMPRSLQSNPTLGMRSALARSRQA